MMKKIFLNFLKNKINVYLQCNLYKSAFTLAEVLITLGIIGIVAAMTMPSLIANYQKKVLEQQAKQAYALLSVIFNKMAADEEVTDICSTSFISNYPQDDNEAYTSYLPQTLGKYIEITGNYVCNDSSDKKCFIKYLKSSNSGDGNIEDYWLFLKNGMKMNIMMDRNVNYWGRLIVDVNGDKAPNTWGRDVFYWHIKCDDSSSSIYPRAGMVYANGNSNDYWKTTGKWDLKCSTTEVSLGSGCTARLMENGWVMDY